MLAPLALPALGADTDNSKLTTYPGYTGEYAGFTLVLDDRFDDFNDKVWAIGDGAVGKESMCRFQDGGVQTGEGTLDLVIEEQRVPSGLSRDHRKIKNAYGYICGEVRTRPELNVRYGRIETRVQAPERATASGYIASLLTYINERNDEGEREWEEIDVEMEGGRPDAFQANLIYGRNSEAWSETRAFGAWEDKINVGPVDRWRVFAIEWVPDSIRWFVDGELVKTLSAADLDCDPQCTAPQTSPTPIPDNPAAVMFNFWIPNDDIHEVFGGNKSANRYPMRAQYDWLRIYQYDAQPMENWQSLGAQTGP